MQSKVSFTPQAMVRELIAYGEPEAAEAIVRLPPGAIEAIGVRAYALWNGIMLDKAICLAVVEHLEGVPRPLRRKRRNYSSSGRPSTR